MRARLTQPLKWHGEYQHEMTPEQHLELLETLEKIEGKFILSGYRSAMYDNHAKMFDWKLHEFNLPNNAAGGKSKQRKIECVWTNY